jgi:hypothetical protein
LAWRRWSLWVPVLWGGDLSSGLLLYIPFSRIFGQQATISAVNAGRDRRLVMRELLIIRQFAIEMPNRVADDRTPNDRQEIGADEQEPKEGDPFDDVRLALCV